MIEVDPAVQEELDRSSAEFQERSTAVTDELTARRQEIQQRAAEADKQAETERGRILDQLKELSDKEKAGQSEPQRPVSSWSVEPRSESDGVMRFGAEDDADGTPTDRAPHPRSRPAAGRHRSARDTTEDDEDYSGESWLR